VAPLNAVLWFINHRALFAKLVNAERREAQRVGA